ncbi:MAG: hypothetical protein ACK528_01085 [Alphaproteobacteria bacterium]
MENVDSLVRTVIEGTSLNISKAVGLRTLKKSLTEICQMVISEHYSEADAALKANKFLPTSQKVELRNIVSRSILFSRQREWSSHGIFRSFRFWSIPEKQGYLQECCRVAESLKQLTPYVTFGFGSVLGFIREGDFIPHDDDMDLLVAFRATPGSCFRTAKKAIWDHLKAQGFEVYNENSTHLTANGADVFVGFIEKGDVVSWFPSKRGGLLLTDVFPVTTKVILDVPCEIPANPERYLEVTYGADWRNPNSDFKHPWDCSQFKHFRIGERIDSPYTDKPTAPERGACSLRLRECCWLAQRVWGRIAAHVRKRLRYEQ